MESGQRPRVHWIDGVRALAALYVVLHHVWLNAFPGFPSQNGPWFVGWLLYGQLGVVVFIVVSGFSLTMVPARGGYNLRGGAGTFARSRAWRILPPYWVALALSMIVVHWVTAPKNGFDVGGRSFVVHGLLLQDVVGSNTPNGTFWSIAVEAQIYLLFPLMLLLCRRTGSLWVAALVAVVVVLAYELALHVHGLARINNFSPALLVGFAFGMAAVPRQLGQSRPASRWTPYYPLVAALLACAVIGLMQVLGPERVVANYFWIDIAVALVVAILFRGLALGQGRGLAQLFSRAPLARTGEFSYSIYLIHGPLLTVMVLYVLDPLELSDQAEFWTLLAIGVPVALLISYAFFKVFERPFLHVRSLPALRSFVFRRPPAVEAAE